jgi:hypothetical protein
MPNLQIDSPMASRSCGYQTLSKMLECKRKIGKVQ